MSDDADTTALLAEPAHDELWLVSYADLLTLLIGFFVLLVAASPMKTARFERMAASLSNTETPIAEVRSKLDTLITQKNLKDKVIATEDEEGLKVELKDALMFDSGSAHVRTPGVELLREMSGLFNELGSRRMFIEGHTDEVPIQNATFSSNWELSAQRAINVLKALEAAGVPKERMSVRSFADTQRMDHAGTPEERRAASRRVVIRVE